MGDDHGYADLRAGARHAGRLWWSFGLVTGFLVAQIVVGLAANSLALLSDAGHMATDALGMALAAITAANRATAHLGIADGADSQAVLQQARTALADRSSPVSC